MKYWLLVASVFCLLTAPAQALLPQDTKFGPVSTITVDGLQRIYSTHLPKGKETEPNLPLVIVLHGAKGSYKKSEGFTGFNEISDKGGFVAVYPNAQNTQWNDGRLPGDTPSYQVDDVHFLSTLIDHLWQHYTIDQSRVYLVGFSSGGMMAQRFAMEKGNKIAGIVPIAASIPVPLMQQNLNPKVSMPVMMINGTADTAFPWKGGTTKFATVRVGAVSPIETTLQYWVKVNGGQVGNSEKVALPDTANDETQVEKYTYHTVAGPDVVLYKVYGGGHSWPGAKYPVTYLPRFLYGKTSQQFNGSEAAWEFLKNYTRTPQ